MKKFESSPAAHAAILNALRAAHVFTPELIAAVMQVYRQGAEDMLAHTVREVGELAAAAREAREASEALRTIKQLGDGHRVDLHSGNIMWRGDTFVIIDPYSFPSENSKRKA